MITLLTIITGIALLAFVFALIWGRQSHEEPGDEIIWRKLDEHEKMLGE